MSDERSGCPNWELWSKDRQHEYLKSERSLAAPTGSANWQYETPCGVNMWSWRVTPEVLYYVTQLKDKIEAHVSTGTRYKFTKTIGEYATVTEAKARCVDHWQNRRHQARRT